MKHLAYTLGLLVIAAAPASATSRQIESSSGQISIETVAEGLVHPWGLAFLPDGRMLVTERPGRLRYVDAKGTVSPPIDGTPTVFDESQGGLLDVALHPNFAENRLVYMSFAEPGEGGASTAVARGRLEDGALKEMEVIFSQRPKVSGGRHFGSRLVFARDGTLFVTTGDRGMGEPAQDPTNHIGTLIRINDDGSVPQDNPFVGTNHGLPEIWSYGHRNAQGAALHPETGELWLNEHGPRGGDEINIPEKGRNYGWPVVSWGRHYSGWPIADPPSRPDLAASIYHWTPVIAVSGMDFYTGDLFPGWKGSILVGGLVSQGIVRLSVDGKTITGEERLFLDARIRQVRQGPDGAVYVLTDDEEGALLKLTPARKNP